MGEHAWRALYWSGQFQISLISFGIQLFPATEAGSEIYFYQPNRKTGERIRHQNVSGEDKLAKDVRREKTLHIPLKDSATKTTKAAHSIRSPKAAKIVAAAVPRSTHKSPNKSSRSSQEEHAAIRLTHPDKILDSESKLTKQQLTDYYWQIADCMLPQIDMPGQ